MVIAGVDKCLGANGWRDVAKRAENIIVVVAVDEGLTADVVARRAGGGELRFVAL